MWGEISSALSSYCIRCQKSHGNCHSGTQQRIVLLVFNFASVHWKKKYTLLSFKSIVLDHYFPLSPVHSMIMQCVRYAFVFVGLCFFMFPCKKKKRWSCLHIPAGRLFPVVNYPMWNLLTSLLSVYTDKIFSCGFNPHTKIEAALVTTQTNKHTITFSHFHFSGLVTWVIWVWFCLLCP